MERQFINRTQTPFFSTISNRLTDHQDELTDLLKTPFSLAAFANQIEQKKNTFPIEKRVLLQNALTKQYGNLANEVIQKQLFSITDENTFFVTTGHQLNLLTGPLYFIYKIAHVIQLANTLKKHYPQQHFIPVYWMASEDHDYEEINHFHLFGKKITWETNQKGAVGKFELENWSVWKNQLMDLFQADKHAELNTILSVYEGANLAEATRKLVHFLFGAHGLLIVDGDDRLLKQQFVPTMRKEIVERFIEKEVNKTNQALEKKGLSPQVYVRPMNLFYLAENSRTRLIPSDDGAQISIENLGAFSQKEMISMVEENPEQFSPNALMRPLYQECVLPNLAYIGGGGELAYWLQLKTSFETADILYPLISIRNSFQIINKNTIAKMEKIQLSFEHFFEDIASVKKKFVLTKNEKSLNFKTINQLIERIENELSEKANAIDKSLTGATAAEIAKIKKSIEGLQKRLIKAEKSKFDFELNKIEQIVNALFPEGKLQERFDNFLPYFLQGGKTWIQEMIDCCAPFNNDFQVLKY